MNTVNVIPLSANEKKILEYIESFMSEQGISPSYQEIKDQFGFASFNSIQRYLRQLQNKGYISIPGGNQKRAISLLRPASALQESLALAFAQKQQTIAVSTPTKAPAVDRLQRELFSLPLLGKVAAGRPIEALSHNETVDVPPHLVRDPSRSFTLKVSGQSMIEDGIFDGDLLIVQEQSQAKNGEICVCSIDGEATVKRFYLHSDGKLARPQIELRPANSEMESMWYSPNEVQIRGIVVGLLRKF